VRAILSIAVAALVVSSGRSAELPTLPGPWVPAWSAPYCTVSIGDPKSLALSIWYVPGSSGVEIYFAGSPERLGAIGQPPHGPTNGPLQLLQELNGMSEVSVDLDEGTRLPATLLGTRPSDTGVLAFGMVKGDFFGHFASSGQLVVRQRNVSIGMRYANAAQALGQLQQCEEAKLKEWGVDSVALKSLRRWPLLPPGSWVKPSDYPPEVMAKLKGGAVVARLSTAASGKVTKCTVVLTSGIAEIDAITCRLALDRAKYRPAIGANGRPTPVTFTNYVTF
jgi:hypothetical protein